MKKIKGHPAPFPTDVCGERTVLAGFFLQTWISDNSQPGLHIGILLLHPSAVLMLSSYISSMRERYNASFGSCHLPCSFPPTLHFPKNCGLKKQNWNHKSQILLPVMLLTHTALSVQRGLKLLSCECKQKFCSYIWEDSAEIIEHIRNHGHFLLISTMKAGCFFCELFKCLLFHRQISHYIYMINRVTHQILGFKFKMPWKSNTR